MKFKNAGQVLQAKTIIPASVEIVFVSDAFVDEYQGGAELTTQALIDASPFEVYSVKSQDVTLDLLQAGMTKFWIFGNFSNLNQQLIPSIVANLQYSVIEYDFKYCKYRSPEKHAFNEKKACDCHSDFSGKIVSAFYHGAKSLWWMSEKQMKLYHKLFPFLRQGENTVLSSVFDDRTFAAINVLKDEVKEKRGWVVCGSPSWIKGAQAAEKRCKELNRDYEVVWGLEYHEVLSKLAKAEGFCYHPQGGDTCPRMVIEAKLLGCELDINDNVMHKDEIWFDTNDPFDTEAYLYTCRDRFWSGIRNTMNYQPSISGYTTTKDCIKQQYPFEQCIESMLGFCDEVVIVDGGSTDGTWEKLLSLAEKEKRLKLHQQKRDWSHKRFAVFDGQQKALARALCTSEFCWQMDSDEIVHESDYDKIKNIVKHATKNVTMVALPVIEYWGCPDKVRVDITPWKWRISRNDPMITHGIPSEFRRFDEDGELYSAPGCDGCFMIRADSYEPVPFMTFYTPEIEQLRQAAFSNPAALQKYEEWFNNATADLPSVHHFSWIDIKRKIHTYKNYWSRHWESLHNTPQEDTAENNKFFDKPWSEVSDAEIDALASRLTNEMGGWVFHSRVDFTNKTPSMKCKQGLPRVMKGWVE